MKKLNAPFGGLFLAVVLSACGGGLAPSGHALDGIPQGAVVISSSSFERAYKFEGCIIIQKYQYGNWVTTSANCGG